VALSFKCGKSFAGTRSIFIFSSVCCSDDGVLLGRGPGCRGVEEGDREEEAAARPRSERRLGRVIVGGLGRVCLPEPFQIATSPESQYDHIPPPATLVHRLPFVHRIFHGTLACALRFD
jgi:hypothetical protein